MAMLDERAWLGDPESEIRKARVPESAAARAARANGARPFPVAAAKLLTLADAATFDVPAVIATLESDPPMAARVLRVVNSAAFGLRIKCRSIKQAVPLLGAAGVREAAVAGSVLNLFPGDGSPAWEQLHAHATLTAALARYLAPEWRLPADEMFTTAFLHDIGKWILLDQEEVYAEVIEGPGVDHEGSLAEERIRFGFDHAELTEHMLRAWKIPEPIPEVVALHHDPAMAYANARLAPRVALLRLANILAHAIQRRVEPDFEQLACMEPMTYLGMSSHALRERYPFLAQIADQSRDEDSPPISRAFSARRPEPSAAIATATCSLCESPSFGVTCPRCGERLCDAHTPEVGRACASCEDELEETLVRAKVPRTPLAAVVGLGSVAAFAASPLLGKIAWLGHSAGTMLGIAAVGIVVLRATARRAFFRR